MTNTKYIFITGGVISSLGKGIAAASIGLLLKSRGFKITFLKIDPYINVDPGTMNPFEHGEVFVTDDGYEADLDLGHYERFAGIKTSRKNNFTAGKVYETVINKERQGKYLGETVQVIPHITDQIKHKIKNAAVGHEIIIVEVGGTVGDIESLPFLEAIRQLKHELGVGNSVFIHLTLVPMVSSVEELKTKPTQHSVNKLREIGIQPDMLMCRVSKDIDIKTKEKIALFTNVDVKSVIEAKDVDFIYMCPIMFYREKMDITILSKLGLKTNKKTDLQKWKNLVKNFLRPKKSIAIALIGKYTVLKDAYKSLIEAINHAALINGFNLSIKFIEAEKFEIDNFQATADKLLKNISAVIVPGGFGARGFEGMINSIKYVRENKIPFLGICLGMQMSAIEFARNVLKLADANSTEANANCKTAIIDYMEEQKKIAGLGGTMRLGAFNTKLLPGSLINKIYNSKTVTERHRHRLELNSKFIPQFEKAGMQISGYDKATNLPEVIEIKSHPWFIGVQFHPEFTSSPLVSHPLFSSFVKAAVEYQSRYAKN